MERSASLVGAHVALLFERQRSLSEARIETTMLRLSGLSERTDIVFADLTAVPADSLMFLELRRRF